MDEATAIHNDEWRYSLLAPSSRVFTLSDKHYCLQQQKRPDGFSRKQYILWPSSFLVSSLSQQLSISFDVHSFSGNQQQRFPIELQAKNHVREKPFLSSLRKATEKGNIIKLNNTSFVVSTVNRYWNYAPFSQRKIWICGVIVHVIHQFPLTLFWSFKWTLRKFFCFTFLSLNYNCWWWCLFNFLLLKLRWGWNNWGWFFFWSVILLFIFASVVILYIIIFILLIWDTNNDSPN